MRIAISITLLTLALTGFVPDAGAHGGEKHAPPPVSAQPAEPAYEQVGGDAITYGAEPGAQNSMSDLLFEREDPLDLRGMEDFPAAEDHAGHEPAPAGGEHAGHDMAAMKKVEISHHEWVSSERKGYGAAVGITVLAGLAFGFLAVRRPFE